MKENAFDAIKLLSNASPAKIPRVANNAIIHIINIRFQLIFLIA